MDEKLNNSEKMLDWNKKLGEQSEYVQKAIEPLFKWEWAYTKEVMDIGHYYGNDDYKNFWEKKNEEDPNYVKDYILKEFSVGDLYDRLTGYDDDKLVAVQKLKSLGIEGTCHDGKIEHIFDDSYLKSLDRENMDDFLKEIADENKFEKWEAKISHVTEDKWIKDKDVFPYFDEILKHNFEGMTAVFGIKYAKESYETTISYASWNEELNNSLWHGDHDVKGGVGSAKNIAENIIKNFDNTQVNEDKLDSCLAEQIEQENAIFNKKNDDRQIEAARKAGYVQGVCECVAAIGDDKTLGKKLLSEMHVTKDMAKKYAYPETYKVLEQGIFAPESKQEQQQSLGGRGR